ncbi:hypothetical protein QR77_33750, partial [Streptomyces sp. 150FB]
MHGPGDPLALPHQPVQPCEYPAADLSGDPGPFVRQRGGLSGRLACAPLTLRPLGPGSRQAARDRTDDHEHTDAEPRHDGRPGPNQRATVRHRDERRPRDHRRQR